MNRRTSATRGAITIAAALVALPVLTALPAHAVESSGCTATPRTPTYAHTDSTGRKVLAYTVDLKCSAGNRRVHVHQQFHELDGPKSLIQVTGEASSWVSFTTAGTKVHTAYAPLPDTEEGQEEMYQKVRIQVSSNGVTSPWTGWQGSAVQAFFN